MRLDKRVSLGLGVARSDARRLVRHGHVTVDGQPVRDPGARVADEAQLSCRGEALLGPQPLYVALHKPAGLVSTREDDHHDSVFTLFPPAYARRLEPVGRLDVDATGLLLLTDDGAWSHRVASPKSGCPKTYRVTLADPVAPDAEVLLALGVDLRGEKTTTAPATLEVLEEQLVDLTVTEGRYHLVKRSFAALGNKVLALHRWKIGDLELGELPPAAWRELTASEVAALAG